jgi:hypothetical protein
MLRFGILIMYLCCGLHAASTPSMTDIKDSKLMQWYDKHNIICSRLRVRTQRGIRGVFAVEDIPAKGGIAVIPPHMIIRSPFKDMEEIVQVNLSESTIIVN